MAELSREEAQALLQMMRPSLRMAKSTIELGKKLADIVNQKDPKESDGDNVPTTTE